MQDTSVGYAGQNRHVRVYWNTLLVLPVIALSLSCARLLPSFSLSPYTASLNSSHLIPCSLSFVLYVSHHLRHPLLLPPLALFHHLLYPLCFCYLSLSLPHSLASSSIFIFIAILPTLTSLFLFSPVGFECRITEFPSRFSWIGYADVTDTTTPHKYPTYTYFSLQHTHNTWCSSCLISCLFKYVKFMQYAWHSVEQCSKCMQITSSVYLCWMSSLLMCLSLRVGSL